MDVLNKPNNLKQENRLFPNKVIGAAVLALSTMQLMATTVAQTISIHKERAGINEILEDIQKQTNYSFIYNPKDFKTYEKKNVHYNRADLKQVLHQLLDTDKYGYEIKSNLITLYRKNASNANSLAQADTVTVRGKVVDEFNKPIE